MRSPFAVIGSLVLLFAVLTIAGFVLFGAVVEDWAVGAFGPATQQSTVALFSFVLLAGDIVLPTPSSVVLAAAGRLLGIALAIPVCTLGLSAGALLGAAAAKRLGAVWVSQRVGSEDYARMAERLQRNALLIVALTRPIPVVAEVVVLTAGTLGIGVRQLAVPVLLGNLAYAAIFACIGAQLLDPRLLVPVFIAAAAIPILVWLGLTRRH